MKFNRTSLQDALLIDLDRLEDERGFFARTFCEVEFAAAGLPTRFAQGNTSWNKLAGTLRGLHYQVPPHAEVKLVRCTRGAILDVIVDLRMNSPTYGHWEGFELTETNGRMLCVPEGFAHGYQTLIDNTEVFYLVSRPYAPGAEAGIHHADPDLGINWPLPITEVSSKDQAWPLIRDAARKRIA